MASLGAAHVPRSFIFFVNAETWQEHDRVGIAGINEPVGWRSNTAYSEVSGIREGDKIFFRLGSERPAKILGMYIAEGPAFYDRAPLFPGAAAVAANLPIRVRFRCGTYYPHPLDIGNLWLSKERGRVWTIHQSRGDVLGRHACVAIDEEESDLLIKLLEAANPHRSTPPDYAAARAALGIGGAVRPPLPISADIDSKPRTPTPGRLRYEAALQARLAEHLADGEYKDILGDYTHFLTYVATGAQAEMDMVLIKRTGADVLWFQVIELKRDTFDISELQKVISYEKWMLNSRCENALQVHSIGIAYEFNAEVIEYVRRRQEYGDRPIRLIRYRFDIPNNRIALTPV